MAGDALSAPERVAATLLAAEHAVVLTGLRPAGGGLEDLFLALTSPQTPTRTATETEDAA